ncbi:hypothetical protein [Rhizobium sp. ZPR3]|uniref:Uncharacterized protein n=2 Tax=unclassified Rhizobium TaxID=2613769 RepID=A0AAU7SAK5_9HYPH
MLSKAINSRSWRGKLASSDYIFVVRDIPESTQLYSYLSAEWPGCLIVKIPALTKGAMLSVLCGVAYTTDSGACIVDLADILFEQPVVIDEFANNIGMIVPVFQSTSQDYSYLSIKDGVVTAAAEKKVISTNASAGVYSFKDCNTYLLAAVHSIENYEKLSFKGNLFICPMVNGILSAGHSVIAPEVSDATPIGKIFHNNIR